MYQVANAPIRAFPFPHLVVHDVFERGTYDEIQRHMPRDADYLPLVDTGRVGRGYSPHRLAMFPHAVEQSGMEEAQRAFWARIFAEVRSDELARLFVAKFFDVIDPRLGFAEPGNRIEFRSETLLMRDLTNYALGPHTDSPTKVISVLYYLPASDARAELGTSLYAPRDPGFTCPGGPHHGFDSFERVTTVPYRPNTMLAFPKTNVCFHGVEPVTDENARRDVLLFDVKLTSPAKPAASSLRPVPAG